MGSIFQEMVDKWPSSLVARTQIKHFTGGLISEKYIANLDSQGRGPAGRVRIGRKIAYPVNEVIQWLQKRATSAKA
jgi:hypothetical protein